MKLSTQLLTGLFATGVFLAFAPTAEAVPATATLNQVSFVVDSSPEPDVTEYYTCDSLQDRTRGLLQKLGATDIHVQCTGAGDPETPTYAPYLKMSFSSVRESASSAGPAIEGKWQDVVLSSFQDCVIDNQLISKLIKYFDVRGFNGTRECMEPDSAYSYKFSVLVAD